MQKTSLDKAKIKILLLEGIHQRAVDAFHRAGYTQVKLLKTALSGDELKAELADTHFVGVRSRTQMTREVIESAPKLNAIGCFCIGTNQVDLAAAMEHGVAVFNAPYSNTRSVAELVLAQAILMMRRIPEKNALAHEGKWQKSAAKSHEIRGKTLGIIGYGSIGSQLSVLAESLGMKVVFYDHHAKLPLGNAEPVASLHACLQQSDVVSLHVPETAETQWMIGEAQIAAMKPGAMLINASRGTVVVIEALAAALESKHLGGAAIDVFPTEPKSNDDPFESPLLAYPQCILTPHIGGSTVEAQENIGTEVADKLIKYSDNGSTLSSVNLPEVALPGLSGKHRLLHVHSNLPGVLAKINTIFSENEINISSQYLQTNDKVGYVVTDIDAQYSDMALAALRGIEGTIRVRVLY